MMCCIYLLNRNQVCSPLVAPECNMKRGVSGVSERVGERVGECVGVPIYMGACTLVRGVHGVIAPQVGEQNKIRCVKVRIM